MRRLFRTLLVASLLLYVGWVASYYYAFVLFSEDVAKVVVHNGAEAWVYLPEGLFWILPVLWLIATIGMWQFSQGARGFFVALTLASIALSVVSGISIQSGPQAAVAQVINLIDGAILAMAFFTSLDSEFRKNASNN